MQSHQIIAQFDIPGMTAAQYDSVMVDLEVAKLSAPRGRKMHIANATPGGWYVTDLWDSQQELDTFAQTLIPTLIKNGVTPPRPLITAVHNVVR